MMQTWHHWVPDQSKVRHTWERAPLYPCLTHWNIYLQTDICVSCSGLLAQSRTKGRALCNMQAWLRQSQKWLEKSSDEISRALLGSLRCSFFQEFKSERKISSIRLKRFYERRFQSIVVSEDQVKVLVKFLQSSTNNLEAISPTIHSNPSLTPSPETALQGMTLNLLFNNWSNPRITEISSAVNARSKCCLLARITIKATITRSSQMTRASCYLHSSKRSTSPELSTQTNSSVFSKVFFQKDESTFVLQHPTRLEEHEEARSRSEREYIQDWYETRIDPCLWKHGWFQ